MMRRRRGTSLSLAVLSRAITPTALFALVTVIGFGSYLVRGIFHSRELSLHSGHELGSLHPQQRRLAEGLGGQNPCGNNNSSSRIGAYGSVPVTRSTRDVIDAFRSDPESEEMKQATRNGHMRAHLPVFSLVQFSSFRMNALKFAVVGFGARGLKTTRQLGECVWKEKGGGHRTTGSVTAYYPGEHHDLSYEALVLVCLLEESTEGDRGGVLLMRIDDADVIVHMEEPGQYPKASPAPPYKHQLTFCSPPLVGRLRPRMVYEWLELHLAAGIDHFVFYDAGAVDDALMATLEPYLDAGVVEVVDAREVVSWDAWDHGHLLLLNDCAPRLRFSSLWGTSFELGEFFTVAEAGAGAGAGTGTGLGTGTGAGLGTGAGAGAGTGAGATPPLLALLQQHPEKPFVSFGSLWWSVEKCVEEREAERALLAEGEGAGEAGRRALQAAGGAAGRLWALQRMQFRWPRFFCSNERAYADAAMCLDYHGLRRYAFDPRKVLALQIHRTEVPRTGGIDISADVARFNRFPDIHNATSPTVPCSKRMVGSSKVEWWVRDADVAEAVERVRRNVRFHFKQVEAQG